MSKINRGKGLTKENSGNEFEIDQKIQNSFVEKTWDETITKDSWMVFKIMSEFVDGYEKLAKIGPCVSIFGSARLREDSPYYQMAVDIAEKITQLGFGIITGGGKFVTLKIVKLPGSPFNPSNPLCPIITFDVIHISSCSDDRKDT